jgi:hypothetical protein
MEHARPSTIQNRNAAAAIDNAANTRAICANSASQPGPEQSVETPRAALPLPNDIANVVTALLDGRTDAADIIAVVSDRLSIARHEHDPGLVLPSPAPELQADGADRADLASAFARWHQQAAQTVQLRRLAAQFRLRRLSSPGQPKVTRVSTWAERDAALRDDAVSIASSGSTASVHTSSVIQPELPFTAPEDMPVGLQSHKNCAIIRTLLESTVDRTLLRWRRRALYTEDNWKEWAAWSPTDRTHRDAHAAGNKFSDSRVILCAPDLRSPDPDKAAVAWDSYRRHLIVEIRQALRFGFPWPDILARLNNTFSHAEWGYPRLASYIMTALDDTVLLDYPLLHADVLIYRLDCSYGSGSRQFESDSMTAQWDATDTRAPGEDLVTLAIRVINAFLMKEADTKLTAENVWDKPNYANQINRRYAECLGNDPANPDRGQDNYEKFREVLDHAKALHARGRLESASHLGCEYLAETEMIPYESRARSGEAPRYSAHVAPLALPPPRQSQATGKGARARRDALRAGMHQHHHEPPPSSYLPDSIDEGTED